MSQNPPPGPVAFHLQRFSRIVCVRVINHLDHRCFRLLLRTLCVYAEGYFSLPTGVLCTQQRCGAIYA